MDDINVFIVRRKGRPHWLMRYQCPLTGQRYDKTSGTANKREALKRAGEWQSELQSGKVTGKAANWAAFRDAYEDHAAVTVRKSTGGKISSTFNVVEQVMHPDSLKRVSTRWLTELQRRLLDSDRSPATVESHFRHRKAALNWAADQGMITQVPKFPKLKRARHAKLMKGRAVTGEEFERMLAVLSAVFPDMKNPEAQRRVVARRQSFKFLLQGLWLSGVRLGEALNLTWDQWADGIRVDADGEFVKLLIPAESEKGSRDRVYPVTPDFAEFLLAVPEDQRTGYVFNVVLGKGVSRRVDSVSSKIIDIGKAAGIKVDERRQGKESIPVWASAHDLRRAFGTRWSRKVTAMILKELMRHASVTTTETYYVDSDADATAAMLAAITGNSANEVPRKN